MANLVRSTDVSYCHEEYSYSSNNYNLYF